MHDLKVLFRSLPRPANDRTEESRYFVAELINGTESFRLGKDSTGRPVLLISVLPRAATSDLAPIVLENVTVSHNIRCRIRRSNNDHEDGEFTIVQCTSDNEVLHSMFLDFVAVLLLSVPNEVSPDEISRTIENLVKLLRSLSTPPRKSIQGLWSELFVILRSRKPDLIIGAWHKQLNDTYDFSMDFQHVEVKSTSTTVRKHHFSLDQLTAPLDTKVLVVSLFAKPSQNGKSIWDLLDSLRRKVSTNPQLALYVENVVSETLGTNWKYVQEDRFDERTARETIAFYFADDIPSISRDLPPEVSNIHFDVDLSNLAPVNSKSLRVAGQLFAAFA